MLTDHPHVAESQPFRYACLNLLLPFLVLLKRHFSIKVKEISLSYHVENVFTVDIPNLQHGNDGLIYTCVNTPYTPGTDRNM